ncbi:MAG TPA: isochorismatase family protein [Candidatus Corynebacterium avicola]|uniref:Isochorismatase family protein n=1 Tax=Candidatus Corynebacterium avicola TaxID=2838527 RepID=A0A9D1RL23_9CORY|nr:isochorismatase family protein [Candidatus Corynebacterium avicola]
MPSALIVIDVQQSFLHRPIWDEVSNPDIVDTVNLLISAARDNGVPVKWVWHTEPDTDDVFDPSQGLVAPMDGLAFVPDEPQFTKTSRNAFTTTNLARHLTTERVDHLVICGIQTEQCCETTARVAADLDYRVTFVTEATATFPATRPDTGDTLPVADIIERTEFALAGRFAEIATVDTVTTAFAKQGQDAP